MWWLIFSKINRRSGRLKFSFEDASAAWPEDESPYFAVGRIIVPAQATYSPQRRVFFDELLSFDPWHAMAAHRPLGNVMRARRKAYVMAAQYRQEMNGTQRVEPKSLDEVPA